MSIPRSALTLVLMAVTLACGSRMPTQPTVTTVGAFSIVGTIHDTTPDGGALAGARVEMVDGPQAGRAAETDASGAFHLLSLTGGTTVRVTFVGYDTMTIPLVPAGINRTIDVALTPSAATISGIVTESAPTEAKVVAGAVVEVLRGAPFGTRTTTDAAGRFALGGISDGVLLGVSRDGYFPREITASPQTDERHVTVRLLPQPATVNELFGTPGSPLGTPFSVFRDVHSPGTISVTDLSYQSTPTRQPMTIQLYGDGILVAESTVPQLSGEALKSTVRGGVRYEVRFLGPAIFGVRVISPN